MSGDSNDPPARDLLKGCNIGALRWFWGLVGFLLIGTLSWLAFAGMEWTDYPWERDSDEEVASSDPVLTITPTPAAMATRGLTAVPVVRAPVCEAGLSVTLPEPRVELFHNGFVEIAVEFGADPPTEPEFALAGAPEVEDVAILHARRDTDTGWIVTIDRAGELTFELGEYPLTLSVVVAEATCELPVDLTVVMYPG